MYIISQMPDSKKWFGESLLDGFYCEGDTYFKVQEKLEEHERTSL